VYLIAPIALATVLGALAGLLLYSDEGFRAWVEASSADPLMAPAALLVLILPVLAAAPEEALFRGWLHERRSKHARHLSSGGAVPRLASADLDTTIRWISASVHPRSRDLQRCCAHGDPFLSPALPGVRPESR